MPNSMSVSTIRWRAVACALSLAAVALPAQKTKPAHPVSAAATAPAPAVLTQLIVVPVSWNTLQHGGPWVGVPLLLCGLVGLIGLFVPSGSEQVNG